ncbi:MAG: hypothetical protein LBK66_05740 [Spirochaetaceae bacterium]|jgi:hypothetical protein|nr:hypothetical protein [Spirochaetaceae bacterium]
MIAIEQTVDIAADGRLRLDMALPGTVPAGRTSVVLVFPFGEESPRRYVPEPFPSIEELKAEAAAKYAEMLETGIDPLARFAGCLKGVFPEDGVEYQRKMRDEWPD